MIIVGGKMNQEREQFINELAENDRKVQEDLYKKDRKELSKEFVDFVKQNNCKLKDDEDGEK